ncbi:DUF6752 domain-containing protein [Marmoricola sp. RAF53]|uniref:DUF6752 domain-containing protein n=1 Tax=Marmoricola sp. RAF53 TaxID=3233059 RepID=UPI003F98DE30
MTGPQGAGGKGGVRQRVTRKLANAAGGGVVDELMTRIADLEAEVQESRQLNVRVAELVDLVTELLLPVASQDRARIEEALAKFERSL